MSLLKRRKGTKIGWFFFVCWNQKVIERVFERKQKKKIDEYLNKKTKIDDGKDNLVDETFLFHIL